MTRILAIAAVLAVAVFLGGAYAMSIWGGGDSDDQFAQCRAAQVAGGTSQIGGPFELVAETGETMTDQQVVDQPALLYFGYTFCPDICPLDAARNAEAVEILEADGTMVKPVFISVDPGRDTPEVLAEFTDYLHPRMLGMTGSAEQVKAASQAYRTYYRIHEPADGDDDFYLVDHSSFTYLVLPEHGFVEFFRREISADQMAKTVSCFVDAAS